MYFTEFTAAAAAAHQADMERAAARADRVRQAKGRRAAPAHRGSGDAVTARIGMRPRRSFRLLRLLQH